MTMSKQLDTHLSKWGETSNLAGFMVSQMTFSECLDTGTDRNHLTIPYSDANADNPCFWLGLPTWVITSACDFGEKLSYGITFIEHLSPFHVIGINIVLLAIVLYLWSSMYTICRRRLLPARFVAGRRHNPLQTRKLSIRYRYFLFALLLCGQDAICVHHAICDMPPDAPSATTPGYNPYWQDTTFPFHDADQRVSFQDLQKGTVSCDDSISILQKYYTPILCPVFQLCICHTDRSSGGLRDFDLFHMLTGDDVAISLMARAGRYTYTSTNTSESDIERSRIYRRHHISTLVAMPPQPWRGYYRTIFAIAPELQIPRMLQDHFLVFQVLPPPEHDMIALIDPYIIAMPADLIPGNSLILLHINPRPELCDYHPSTDCQVVAIPRRCTRAQFILAANLQEQCRPTNHQVCELVVAGRDWPDTNFDWRYIYDGTYATVVFREQQRSCTNMIQLEYEPTSFMQSGPLLHFQGVLFVAFPRADAHDLVKSYLITRYPELHERHLVTIHGWHVHFPGQLFTVGYISHHFQQRYSWTNQLLHNYAPFQDAEEVVIADIRPLPPPLTLRDNAITLISIPARAYRDGYVAYLVDSHIDRHVSRKAVVVQHKTRCRDICIALQLNHLLNNPNRFIKLYYRLPPDAKIYALGDTVELPHGSFLTLLSYDLENCPIDEPLTIDSPEDALSFMQRPPPPCAHYSYPAAYFWNFVHPTTQTILLSVWYHPWLYTEYFLQNERQITIHRSDCIRCRLQQLWYDHLGRRPITLVPLRTYGGGLPPRYAIAVLTVDDPHHRLVFIEYRFRQQWRFGTLLFAYPALQVPVGLLFNRAEPQNDCAYAAWCRAEIDNIVTWYPDHIPVYEGAWIRLHEIPIPDDEDGSQTTADPHCSLPNVDTSSDGGTSDSSTFLQLWSDMPFRDPLYGLPPPGNPDLDTLDDVLWIDDKQQVVDLHPLRPLPTPCRAPQAHFPATFDDSAVRLPDLQPLIEQIFQPVTSQPLDLQMIHDILPEELSQPFRDIIIDLPPTMPAIHIYTDGSYSTKSDETSLAAWSFVVLVEYQDEVYLIDYGYGLVEPNELEPGWTGAIASGAREAELDGLLHAAEWTLRKAYAVPTTFHYDSLAAGHVADGRWQAKLHDKQANLLRSVALTLRTFAGADFDVSWQHIQAHKGHLGNEIADAIAKHAFRHQLDAGISKHIEYMPFLFGQRPPIQWLWYYFRCFDIPNDFPAEPPTAIAAARPKKMLELSQVLPAAIIDRVTHISTSCTKTLPFRFLCFNAGTLNETDGKARQRIVPVYLREQLAAHHANIIFLQETRAVKSCMIESSTHTRLISQANSGHGGTEIWCQKFVGKHNRPAFHARDLLILHSDPEVLIMKMTYTGKKLLCISAHAPHTGRPQAQHHAFWNQLCSQGNFMLELMILFLGLMPMHIMIASICRMLALMD